jgi:hypothetical protein
VPDSRWYEARAARKLDAEVATRRAQLKSELLPTLRPELRERFGRLEAMRARIAAQPLSREHWFDPVRRKLDLLLEQYLQFSHREGQFRTYLRSVLDEVRRADPNSALEQAGILIEVTEDRGKRRVRGRAATAEEFGRPPESELPEDPADRWVCLTVDEIQDHYTEEAEEVRALREREQDPNTQAVLQKRGEVLQRRREGIGKIGKILLNLHQQLRLVEDTFGLINDELRARSPEQALADIDEVVGQTESMTRLLEEMAPYEQAIARLRT